MPKLIFLIETKLAISHPGQWRNRMQIRPKIRRLIRICPFIPASCPPRPTVGPPAPRLILTLPIDLDMTCTLDTALGEMPRLDLDEKQTQVGEWTG